MKALVKGVNPIKQHRVAGRMASFLSSFFLFPQQGRRRLEGLKVCLQGLLNIIDIKKFIGKEREK